MFGDLEILSSPLEKKKYLEILKKKNPTDLRG